MAKIIIITGNPIHGLEFIGPFETVEDAIKYGDIVLTTEWWTAELEEPETFETNETN